MKKLYIVLFVIFVTLLSCEKTCAGDQDGNMSGCSTFWVAVYTLEDYDFDVNDYLDVEGSRFTELFEKTYSDGDTFSQIRYHAKWENYISVTAAEDPDGYKFTGWVADPNRSYCYRVEPNVDPENFRTAYVYGSMSNMQGCNSANMTNYLTATYTKIK